ncbi:hypothetical protein MTX26_04665 [Bradyrhizobium sp. ISRA443]|uniref:hypothetical protein n=1 Tax=unclassified Bradyrhizobium TaxID=2631580 RepID=UPI0024797793|nr:MULTISPECIES: hypothetical protein [unclassified Bradyrhizobium]WGS00153.1 hypothetical protein MTX23_04665 [Bradyrhizobium sp. ISRA436]WGS07042.1 hypothetical protein MTX18_04665 [Bradyrhizobium sp. ISRA437]WGS13925.1 hypothetical protein MTX26_04665 [Bradyrhizobium sp. ISRA443]
MLSYLKKFAMDIFPSVAATIIGAYIVNHYIVAKPEAPAQAAVSATATPVVAKPAEKPTVVSSLPEAGVKAKGISEKTLIERSASEKATVTEKPAEKSADVKATDSPAETASIPADTRHHSAPKAVAKLTPAAPAAEAAVAPEEGRDANDLARAAIERLRKESPPRAQEAVRQEPRPTEMARLPEAQRAATPQSIRPLPPPIMVSNPTDQSVDQSSQPRPPYAADASDPDRLTPPADIPVARAPLDLRAEASEPPPPQDHTVADDMLSAAKSVFHAVLPK